MTDSGRVNETLERLKREKIETRVRCEKIRTAMSDKTAKRVLQLCNDSLSNFLPFSSDVILVAWLEDGRQTEQILMNACSNLLVPPIHSSKLQWFQTYILPLSIWYEKSRIDEDKYMYEKLIKVANELLLEEGKKLEGLWNHLQTKNPDAYALIASIEDNYNHTRQDEVGITIDLPVTSNKNGPNQNKEQEQKQEEEQQQDENEEEEEDEEENDFNSKEVNQRREQEEDAMGQKKLIEMGFDHVLYIGELIYVGAKIQEEFQSVVAEILHDRQGLFKPGPLKKLNRCIAKVEQEYRKKPWPTASHLLDIVRCCIICPTPKELRDTFDFFVKYAETSPIIKIGRIKNTFKSPEASFGYRDLKVNVIYKAKSGLKMICELQFILEAFLEGKSRMHPLYEIVRDREFYESVCDVLSGTQCLLVDSYEFGLNDEIYVHYNFNESATKPIIEGNNPGWIGIIPRWVQSRDEYINDQQDIAFESIRAVKGTLILLAKKIGEYEIRAFSRDDSGIQIGVGIPIEITDLQMKNYLFTPEKVLATESTKLKFGDRFTVFYDLRQSPQKDSVTIGSGWIGIVPGSMESRKEEDNDAVDIAYEKINQLWGSITFSVPEIVGEFKLKAFSDDDPAIGQQVGESLSFTTFVDPSIAPYLATLFFECDQKEFAEEESSINVTYDFTNAPELWKPKEDAWIGLVNTNVKSRAESLNQTKCVARFYCEGLKGIGKLECSQCGEFQIKAFTSQQNGVQIGGSMPMTVKLQSLDSWSWDDTKTFAVKVKQYEYGSSEYGTVNIYWDIRNCSNLNDIIIGSAWIGIIPINVVSRDESINDQYDIDYFKLHQVMGKNSLSLPLDIPRDYWLKLFTRDDNGVQVGESIKLTVKVDEKLKRSMNEDVIFLVDHNNSNIYGLSEIITINYDFSNIVDQEYKPIYEGSGKGWIGIIPNSIVSREESVNDQHDLEYFSIAQYPKGVGKINALKLGSYFIKAFTTDNNGQQIGKSVEVTIVDPNISKIKFSNDLVIAIAEPTENNEYLQGSQIKIFHDFTKSERRDEIVLNSGWIGIIPSSVNSDKEGPNDEQDIDYFAIKEYVGGNTLVCKGGPGSYHIKAFTSDASSVGRQIGNTLSIEIKSE